MIFFKVDLWWCCHTFEVILDFPEFVSIKPTKSQLVVVWGLRVFFFPWPGNFVSPICLSNSVVEVLNGLIIIKIVDWFLDSSSFQFPNLVQVWLHKVIYVLQRGNEGLLILLTGITSHEEHWNFRCFLFFCWQSTREDPTQMRSE